MTQPISRAPAELPTRPTQRPPGVAGAALPRLPVTPFAHLVAPKPILVGGPPVIAKRDDPTMSHGRGERAPSSSGTAAEPMEEVPVRSTKKWANADATDPLMRSLCGTAWPYEPVAALPNSVSGETATSSASRVSLEQLWPKVVRRVAWSGDAHSGTARLELGEGALAGATLIIHSDRGAVRVQLEVPPGADAAEWKERIGRRLDARGLYVAELDVR